MGQALKHHLPILYDHRDRFDISHILQRVLFKDYDVGALAGSNAAAYLKHTGENSAPAPPPKKSFAKPPGFA